MRLILVRHGQSEGNAGGVIQGHLDFGLSGLGRRQAEATAARLAEGQFQRVVTSPLRRASDTASVIARALGIEAEFEPGLMEYNIGAIAGLTGAEVRARYPDIARAYGRNERPLFPGEEGRVQFLARVTAVVEAARQSGRDTVAVAHGGVVGAICYAALGLDYSRPGVFQSANCSITELAEDRSGRMILQRLNDTCHLRGIVTEQDRG